MHQVQSNFNLMDRVRYHDKGDAINNRKKGKIVKISFTSPDSFDINGALIVNIIYTYHVHLENGQTVKRIPARYLERIK